jgi:signal transduction histidine kinase/ActR/RegA family two-component response regulator
VDERILLLALRGRDAPVIAQLLAKDGHDTHICHSCEELAREMAAGAGAALATEESLTEADTRGMVRWLSKQPAWSDFPFILLATKRSGRRPPEAQALLEQLGNLVVLERPIHSETLGRAVASALRGRRRQYETRRHLHELELAKDELRQFNETLESRINDRTVELAHANDLLMQEIGERERAQAALVQSQKMEAVGQLTGGIAHDFNNLLTVIAGNMDLIQRKAPDAKIAAMAGYGLEAANRAAKLTRQLLAFSRTQRLTLHPVDINGMLESLHQFLPRSLGPEHAIALTLDKDQPWALADSNQLELAVINLALNARDAMAEGGTVRIESSQRSTRGSDLRDGDYVVVAVSDTGSGIPPHIIDRVFDPFFTTKPTGKGTGLGLSQVYGIAKQSGGTARIHSTVGRGSTVEVWLPRALAPADTADPANPAARPALRGLRILVVEDDPGVRRYMVECLEGLGHTVTEASDGQEGLERLKMQTPSLLIVDYAMPGMNGVEVIQAARTVAPDLPILMATGYADMRAVSRVIGPEQVLRKPFQIADLEQAILRVLSPDPDQARAGPTERDGQACDPGGHSPSA